MSQLTLQTRRIEAAAREAARAVSPLAFKNVHRGVILSAARLWSQHRCWLMARWNHEYIVLRADGRLFLCRNQIAAEVTAEPDQLEHLFAVWAAEYKLPLNISRACLGFWNQQVRFVDYYTYRPITEIYRMSDGWFGLRPLGDYTHHCLPGALLRVGGLR